MKGYENFFIEVRPMAFGHNIDLRKMNKRNHVIDLFREYKILSKAKARTLSGYSMDTIISIFNSLSKEKLIVPSIGVQKEKGRKALFYSLNNEKNLYIGVTFNQTGIFSTIMSFSFAIKDQLTTHLKLGTGKEEFLKIFIDHIKGIIEKNQLSKKQISGIGCSIPGDIDLKTGILHTYTLMPFLKELNFMEILHRSFPNIGITIDHNIHSMTSYIMRDQELVSSFPRILFVSARSGAANGYIFNGSIVTGHGEFGHIKVSDAKIQCICGRYGCLDCFFSYRSFINLLKEANEDISKSDINADEEFSGLERLSEYFSKGNNPIAEELNKRLYYFSMALLDVINAVTPDLVILTGELFKVYKEPIEEIKRIIDSHFDNKGFVTIYEHTEFRYREMGTEMASIGICFEMIRRDWEFSNH